MLRFRRFLSLSLAMLAASCATPPRPAAPPPPPPPQPAAPPPPADWRDLPETKGGWRYLPESAASSARFESGAGALLFLLRCDKAVRHISLSRTDSGAGAPLKVTTSYGSRTLASPDLPASDSLFDQIAFSRGRFTIEASGLPELVLPAWAEPGRVIEDCRS